MEMLNKYSLLKMNTIKICFITVLFFACNTKKEQLTNTIWIGVRTHAQYNNETYADSLKFKNDSMVDWYSGYLRGQCFQFKYLISNDSLILTRTSNAGQYGETSDIVMFKFSEDKMNLVKFSTQGKYDSKPRSETPESLSCPLQFLKQ